MLGVLLGQDFPGAAELRRQARSVLAAGGCPCGCGTLTLLVPDPDAPRATALVDAHPAWAAFPAPGEGGVLTVVTANGLLAELRLSRWGAEPVALPAPGDLTHLRCASAGEQAPGPGS